MKPEYGTYQQIEAAKLAVIKPRTEDRIQLNLSGYDITFGLPDTSVENGIELIDIPDTPYIFKANLLLLNTKRQYISHKTIKFDQIILIGHGKKYRDDPRTWFFEDGQNVVDLAADYNSSDLGLPPINMIVSCRRVLPMNKEEKTFKSTRPPLGWNKLTGVIFQKNGNPKFIGTVHNWGITASVLNYDSDFMYVTKKGTLKNLRKSGIQYY